MNTTTTTVKCFVMPEDAKLLEEFEKTHDLKVWEKNALSWATFYKKVSSTCSNTNKKEEDDLIKRHDAINALCDYCSMTKAGDRCTDDFCPDVWHLKEVPSAQKKGEWIDMDDHVMCSCCGATHYGADKNYCPNCGADMKGDKG